MRFSEEEKAMWVEDWRRSGKSAWTYAKENGLIPQTFTRWTRGKPQTKPSFVEIPVQSMPSLQYPPEILIEKGDVKIHIPLSLGCVELRAIFSTLTGSV
jgi:transposase-like protein